MSIDIAAQNTTIHGFEVRLDLAYDRLSHLWVSLVRAGAYRLGSDPLGSVINGTLAQLQLSEVGTRVARGEAFGTLEAEKFVGPFRSPLTGTITAVNGSVVERPSLVELDPYGEGWIVELSADDPAELSSLVSGADQVTAWFSEASSDYQRKGLLAQ